MQVKGKYSWLKHLDFIFIDVILLIVSFTLSYALKFDELTWWNHDEWSILCFFICLLDILLILFINPYSGALRRTNREDFIAYFFFTVYNIIIVTFFFYFLKVGALFSREMLFETYGCYFIVGYFIKRLWKKFISTGKLQKKIYLYVICDKDNEKQIYDRVLMEDVPTFEIVGVAYKDGFVKDLLQKNAQEVFIAINPSDIKKETYEQLLANGIKIHFDIETITGVQTEDQLVTKVGLYKTLTVGSYSFTPNQLFYLGIKRLFDIFCGIIGLIVLIPLSIIVKIANLLNKDTKSIFYTHTRIGQYGKEIKIYKFRSMVPNADEMLKEMLKDPKYKQEWEENQKFENDPRITKIGNFLRKTSLDEIPQLINVLKGEMSLVGPRPLVEGELESHEGLKLYTQVKPGITGWWGCNGRSNIDYRERLELEYYYVKNCSLYLDILCIFKTVFAVLRRDGSK